METLSTPNPSERRTVDGKTYQRVDTGYTVREYYSHETAQKGPGPGWDTRERLLDDEFALRETGRTFTLEELDNPMNLPNTTLYRWEEVIE